MYQQGKIYKLQCDDGYYYIGSTCNPLCKRIANHREASKTNTNRLYSHVATLGWEKVRIVLLENHACNNKDELRKREDEHIQTCKTDSFCLNTLRAFVSNEERNAEKVKYNRTLPSYQDRLTRKKEKTLCSCGKHISQGHLATHLKTKYHDKHKNEIRDAIL